MKLTGRDILRSYIPENAIDAVCDLLNFSPVKVNIVNPRKRIHGSYRRPKPNSNYHLITVNKDLNQYTFLITLLHEIAHLQVFVKNKSFGHGQDWKNCFRNLIEQFIVLNVFPDDVKFALARHINNVKSSDFLDIFLTKTLQKYDNEQLIETQNLMLLEDLPKDTVFVYGNKKMEKKSLMRKYYLCKELKTNKLYRCHPLMKVSLA